MKINIIGGGLAGCTVAFVLKRAGFEPVIYEAGPSLASGASGNEVGLYNPRFTAEYDAVGQYYATAFERALDAFKEFGDAIEWNPCSALHLMNDEKKAKRFPKMVESWAWDQAEIVNAEEASKIAGIEIDKDCLYLPQSGTVSPRKLCEAYARDVEVHLNTKIEEPEGTTILACGMGVKNFIDLPLKAVRGQITYIEPSDISKHLKTTIGYGGYISPVINGTHCLGSTFQRWLDHSEIIEEDDRDNLEKFFDNIPAAKGDYSIQNHRASVRTTAPDHFPIVGQVSDNVYVSTAHGSHGILSSLLAAEIICAMLQGKKMPVSDEVLDVLKPLRFL